MVHGCAGVEPSSVNLGETGQKGVIIPLNWKNVVKRS